MPLELTQLLHQWILRAVLDTKANIHTLVCTNEHVIFGDTYSYYVYYLKKKYY